MNVVIVGHGPSILNEGRGKEIDEYDVVIRLKRTKSLLSRPHIFGTKTDIVMGSLVLWQDMLMEWDEIPGRYWLFVDTRTMEVTDHEIKCIQGAYYPKLCVIDKGLCEKWVNHYRGLRNGAGMDPRQEAKVSGVGVVLSDKHGHLHCSAGMFAIIYALHYLKPDKLDLLGFDNIASGEFDWSITRGPSWSKYPDHNWEAENRMLSDVAEDFGYQVENEEGNLCCLNM